jgi:hypothetical protein
MRSKLTKLNPGEVAKIQKPLSWQEEFDKAFNRGIFINNLTGEASYSRIKFFIQSTLDQQRQELLEKILNVMATIPYSDDKKMILTELDTIFDRVKPSAAIIEGPPPRPA